jgi:two-component system response regulator NreC
MAEVEANFKSWFDNLLLILSRYLHIMALKKGRTEEQGPAMSKIRTLLADDHTILRQGLRKILEADPAFEVVGEAGDGREAVKKAEEHNPDVVVMDISMPTLNGIEATRQIIKTTPKTRILILTVHENDQLALEILQAGATGYLLKDAASEELLSAIKAVYRGDSYLSPTIAKRVISQYLDIAKGKVQAEDKFSLLTSREREILQLIAEGYSNKEIADQLYISEKTVKTHRENIMRKLDLHSVAELVKYALSRGII